MFGRVSSTWSLMGAAWGVLKQDKELLVFPLVSGICCLLVVPVMVVENKSPLASLKESTRLLRHTWGEQLISNFSFGMVFFLLTIPAFLVAGLGIYMLAVEQMVVGVICLVAAILYAIVLSLVQSTLQCIFQASLYFYARDGHAPAGAGFVENDLRGAYRLK